MDISIPITNCTTITTPPSLPPVPILVVPTQHKVDYIYTHTNTDAELSNGFRARIRAGENWPTPPPHLYGATFLDIHTHTQSAALDPTLGFWGAPFGALSAPPSRCRSPMLSHSRSDGEFPIHKQGNVDCEGPIMLPLSVRNAPISLCREVTGESFRVWVWARRIRLRPDGASFIVNAGTCSEYESSLTAVSTLALSPHLWGD